MNNTVIIIDDDKDQVSLLSEIIENFGKKVSGTGFNGKDAIELFEKYKPDIVFLDIMMPESDGFHAIDKIKKINAEAKIVVITGDITEKTSDRLKASNVSIIYKPFEISTIAKIL